MLLSLWSFPGGYCVFQVINVVRTLQSSREGMAAFEGSEYCGWSSMFFVILCDSVRKASQYRLCHAH